MQPCTDLDKSNSRGFFTLQEGHCKIHLNTGSLSHFPAEANFYIHLCKIMLSCEVRFKDTAPQCWPCPSPGLTCVLALCFPFQGSSGIADEFEQDWGLYLYLAPQPLSMKFTLISSISLPIVDHRAQPLVTVCP